jgi:hypothetical protein
VITQSAVLVALGDGNWDVGEQQYIRYHLRRFVFWLKLVGEVLDRGKASTAAPARYRNVAPHFMTGLVDNFRFCPLPQRIDSSIAALCGNVRPESPAVQDAELRRALNQGSDC